MGKQFTFTLDSLDVGQLLDGLDARAKSWEGAADYLRTATMPDGQFFLVKECSEPEEADAIARHYRTIIETMRSQMEAQR